MSGRFARGLTAIDASLDVFRERPQLAVLPVASVAALGTAYAGLALALLHFDLLGAVFSSRLVRYGALFAALALSSGLGVFFNAAVVHCADQYFRGEGPVLRDGLEAAWAVRWTIAKWSLLSATVGTLLYVLEETVPGVGSLTRAVLDLAWAAATFFVVPVIVLERQSSVSSSLWRSGGAFRQTWGESVTATVGVGLALLPIALVGTAALVVAYLGFDGPVAYALGALGGVVLAAYVVLSQVLGAVVRTALYRYARTGAEIGPLREIDPDDVFSGK